MINIPDKKSALVKQLLRELGVTIDKKAVVQCSKPRVPNALTAKTIEDARNGRGLEGPIIDLKAFMDSL